MNYKDSCPLSQVVRQAYKNGEEDETLLPLVLTGPDGRPVGRIKKGDSVIFYNIRGEREIELTESLTAKNFEQFPGGKRARPRFCHYDPVQRGA